jgi:hypothetical protein
MSVSSRKPSTVRAILVKTTHKISKSNFVSETPKIAYQTTLQSHADKTRRKLIFMSAIKYIFSLVKVRSILSFVICL